MSGKSDNIIIGQPGSVARQTLVDMIEEYGLSLADDPRRCEGLLRDLCGSCRREINILMAAVHENVAVDLLGANDQLPREVTVGRLVKRLVDDRGLTRDVAVWAVESWALACGVMTLQELTPPGDPKFRVYKAEYKGGLGIYYAVFANFNALHEAVDYMRRLDDKQMYNWYIEELETSVKFEMNHEDRLVMQSGYSHRQSNAKVC